ncbi:TPA: amidase [Enterobacter hormaechei subsp. xiangfangensis]|nr:amidase [Enterobacter hormaechei subsp. xiangfangensis]
MNDALVRFSVVELAALIAQREISPVEIVEAYLDRISRCDRQLHAFVEVYHTAARAQAKLSEKEISSGRYRGPLHGIPLGIKDFFDLAGTVTGGGTYCFTQAASTTAPVLKTLLQCGMIAIGKHRAVELGMGAAGIVATGPTPRNPWKPEAEFAAGGSSNGSAVAVAAGLCPVALTTDTGGSTRIPAAWCGVCGFRPSSGLLSLQGVLPLSQTMDTVGIMARNSTDAALIYQQLCPQEAKNGGASRLNIAALPVQQIAVFDAEIAQQYQMTLRQIMSEDVNLTTVELPVDLALCMRANSQITAFEAWRNYHYLCDAGSLLGQEIIDKLQRGKDIEESAYRRALRYCHHVRRDFFSWFQSFDALIIPTTPKAAWPVAENENHAPPNDFTRFVNFSDLCSVAIPSGLNADGLPLSIQIICNKGEEGKALAIAGEMERRIRFKIRPLNA